MQVVHSGSEQLVVGVELGLASCRQRRRQLAMELGVGGLRGPSAECHRPPRLAVNAAQASALGRHHRRCCCRSLLFESSLTHGERG